MLSQKFPVLLPLILWARRTKRKIEDFLNSEISIQKSQKKFPCILARHQSVLRRRFGDSDMNLQEQKVKNLEIACEKLDGIIIEPGKIFSLWEILGNPSYKNGFVDGMLLSDGKVVAGAGGGLCQLSNFLCWVFLHTEIEIIERHHHSRDVFPDSGRTLPFGSGATIFYNLLDLKIKNISPHPLQIHIFTTEKYLKGQILSTHHSEKKFHITEKFHTFIKSHGKFFRYNKIWREVFIKGEKQSESQIFTNFAPVLYKISDAEKYISV